MEQLSTQFYGQTTARARYFHILRFLNFTDNDRNGVDRTDDRLWKIRDLFEIIRTNFSKFYNPSEHLAVDEVIVKFKGRVLFKHYIPKKRKLQNAFYFTYFCRLVLEIFRFFEKLAQSLNTPQNNSASWDLHWGFNSVFKGLSDDPHTHARVRARTHTHTHINSKCTNREQT
jgi:hypothetical protein